MTCSHEGYHSGRGRYDRPTGMLRYVMVCDDCQAEIAQILVEPYAPSFRQREAAGPAAPADGSGAAPPEGAGRPDAATSAS